MSRFSPEEPAEARYLVVECSALVNNLAVKNFEA